MYKVVSMKVTLKNVCFKLENHVVERLKSVTQKRFIRSNELEEILSESLFLKGHKVINYLIISTNGENRERGLVSTDSDYRVYICLENKLTKGGHICSVLMPAKRKTIIKNFTEGDVLVYLSKNSLFGVTKQIQGKRKYIEIDIKKNNI